MEASIILPFVFFLVFSHAYATDQRCPAGQYTKEKPSPESDLLTCKIFSCNSCCTKEITEQLVLRPLQMVGGMNYTQCGGLSDMCSMWSAFIQCFYQCSPNLTPWLDSRNYISKMPVCSTFCEAWYLACSHDQTCVDGTSWAKGFNAVTDPSDSNKKTMQCRPNVPCKNYTQVYPNAKAMCNQMWPGMLEYSTDNSSCMDPANMLKNSEIVQNIRSGVETTVCDPIVEYTDTGMIIGIVVGVIAAIVLVGAVIMLVRNNKKKAKKQPPPNDQATNEMKSLNQPEE